MQEELIKCLAEWCTIPVTYAGGVRDLDDLRLIRSSGKGRVNFTIGSALDIFGGTLPYTDVLAWLRA